MFVILQLIDNDGTPTQFLDASNRFYTLIPHDFGMKKPPMLDTKEIISVRLFMTCHLEIFFRRETSEFAIFYL